MRRALGAVVVIVATLLVFAVVPTVDGLSIRTGGAGNQDPSSPSGRADEEQANTIGSTAFSVEVDQGASEASVPAPEADDAVVDCAATEASRRELLDAVLTATPAERQELRTAAFDHRYHRAVVATMYCQILQRPVDAEGLEFWAEELADGLDVYDLYLLIANSEEYRLRETLTQTEVLEALGDVSAEPTTTEESASPPPVEPEEVDPVEDPDDGAPDAAQATTIPPTPQTTTTLLEQAEELATELDLANGGEGLRVRTPITVDAFTTWAETHGLQDIDYVTGALVHGTRHSSDQKVHVAYVHLSQTRGVSVSPGTRGRAVVGAWAAEIGAHVAVNGNWYAPWDGPAVSDGVVYAGSDHGYTSLFGFTADGDAIIEHHREVNTEIDPRIVEGLSGHPTLVHRGEPTTDFGTDPTFLNRHPRTAIGLDSTGDVLILVTVDGRRSSAVGMTGSETVQLMADLGAFDAVMLDGGGSSTMWIADRGVVNSPSGSLRAVGNQIAVFGD